MFASRSFVDAPHKTATIHSSASQKLSYRPLIFRNFCPSMGQHYWYPTIPPYFVLKSPCLLLNPQFLFPFFGARKKPVPQLSTSANGWRPGMKRSPIDELKRQVQGADTTRGWMPSETIKRWHGHYICICIYIYIYIHAFYMYACIYIYTHANVYVNVYANEYVYA